MTSTARSPQTDEREDDDQEPRRPMWELAECTCPDFCERDHELD